MFDFEAIFAGKPEPPKPKPKPAEAVHPKTVVEPSQQSQNTKPAASTQSQPAPQKLSSLMWITPKNQLDTVTDHERISQFEKLQKSKDQKLAEIKTLEQKELERSQNQSDARAYEHETRRIMNRVGGKTSPPPVGQKWGKQTRAQKNQEKMMSTEAAYEKAGNYKRQNMKKGYTERVSSKAGYYRSHFLPNGKRKSFYKKQDEQEDDIEDQGDKYVPDEALAIGTEKMNLKQKLEHQEEIFKIDVEKMAEEDTTTVTKENLVFKLMNDGFKLLLLDRRNVPADMMEVYDKRTRGLGSLVIPTHIENDQGEALTEDERKEVCWTQVLNSSFPIPPLPGNDKVKFHPFQYEFLKALDSGRHCFADFYTGAGKSLIFQFHAAVHHGMTIVIVPLISLMIDQVKKVPVDVPSVCYTSWISAPDRARILGKIKAGSVKVLFVTPELFASEIAWFVLIYNVKVNLVCIDEAHCVSVHSPSFRHAYALIPDHIDRLRTKKFTHTLKECFQFDKLNHLSMEEEEELAELDASIVKSHSKPKPEAITPETSQIPILCLTATCSKEAKSDILEQLRLEKPLLQASQKYIRDNLIITVSKESQFIKNIAKLLELGEIKGKRPVLVYSNFMKVVEGVKNTLSQCGYNAVAFTSMQTELARMNILQKFLLTDPHHNKNKSEFDISISTKFDCVVTTVSLAMGIDHRSIRVVVHYNMPGSLETYVQEVGRGGRDGLKTYCHTFLTEQDYTFQRAKCFSDRFIDKTTIRKVIKFLLGVGQRSADQGKNWRGTYLSLESRNLSYIKVSSIEGKFGIKAQQFITIMQVVKEFLRDKYDIHFEYSPSLNCTATIQSLRPTLMKQFNESRLVHVIKSNSKKIRDSYSFNVVHVANLLNITPQYLLIAVRELAQKLQFSMRSLDPAVVFTNVMSSRLSRDGRRVDYEQITNSLYWRNIDLIREGALKVDCLYMLLDSQARNRDIAKFSEADIKVPSGPIMEKYVKSYFEEGPAQMISLMKADKLIKRLPIIFLRSDEKTYKRPAEFPPILGAIPTKDGCVPEALEDFADVSDTTEIKEVLSKFFQTQLSFIELEMAGSNSGPSYSKVFTDFVTMLLGGHSKTFPFTEWKSNEFWGKYEYYDMVGVLPELEAVFASAFETFVLAKLRGTFKEDEFDDDVQQEDPALEFGEVNNEETGEAKPQGETDTIPSKPLVRPNPGPQRQSSKGKSQPKKADAAKSRFSKKQSGLDEEYVPN